MIVKMSKVEIIGVKELLQDTLSLLRELGIFHIEPETVGFVEKADEKNIRAYALDEKTLLERMFLEELRLKIDELFSYLPKTAVRSSYLEPRPLIDTIAKIIERHLASIKEIQEQRAALERELSELGRYSVFLKALAALLKGAEETPDLDFIGLTIKEPGMVDRLREALSRITGRKFELATGIAEDGALVGLISVDRGLSSKVKSSLSDEQVPEMTFPSSFNGLSISGKLSFVKNRTAEVSGQLQAIAMSAEQFTRRWKPIYQKAREWIDDRLSLLNTVAFVYETKMCFFINGWMPSRDREKLRKNMAEAFGQKVTIEEKELREADLERVPIILQNPPYFKPFELFTRFLPLPLYSSFDPTPFIGIFFPIFFGIILGDAGYGVVLGLISLQLMKKFRKGMVRDAAKILMIASFYSFFFGVLFGEFFGDLPERLFHLKPLCIERREAVIPMLFFAVAIGAAHVLLGLLFGVIAGFRKKEKKEAVSKLLNIVIILGLIIVLASFFQILPVLLARPIIIAILFLTPLLFFTGGLLAPLELLKSIGNIISYVRITAIGLTSVLLAFAANRLGGLTGDIVTGVVVAGLLHLLNIILGVFSPTIHSLRLHYVEFFSKFMEHGGRKFDPFMKTK